MEQNILELTGDGYLRLAAADARILAANDAAARILDWPTGAQDLVGRTLPEVRQCPLAARAQALRGARHDLALTRGVELRW